MMTTLQAYKNYKPIDLNFTKQIPSNWIVKRGKFFFRGINERSKKGEEQLLSVSEHKGIVPRDSINVTMFQAQSYEGYKLCNKSDIVINSLWAWHRGLGVSEYHGIVSTAYGVYRPLKPEQWNHRYLNYLLRDKTYVGECLIRSKGIWESRYQLTGSNFLDIPVLQPPLKIQNSIVAYLDKKNNKIDTFIRNKERLIELLEEEQKVFVLEEIASDKYVIEKKKLKYVAFLSRGVDLSNEKFRDGKYPVYGSNGIIGYHSNFTTKGPCITVGRSGSVGEVNFVNGDFWAHNTALYVCRNYKNDWKFIFYLMIGLDFKSYAAGSAVGTLNRNNIHQIVVNIPNFGDQKEIVEVIEKKLFKLNSAISKARSEISSIKEYREALITYLVTGKRSVPEPQRI